MKNNQKLTVNFFHIFLITGMLIGSVTLGCTTDEGPSALDSVYSGAGSFNFTGDYNFTFQGNVSNARIEEINSRESLPLSFTDNQGRELFVGLRGNPNLSARTYNAEDLLSEGFVGITLEGEVYDSGSIGGIGTVTLTKLSGKEILGRVDLRLARPLNTADTVLVKGTFELEAN